jgi:hypothetical protein
VVEAQPNVPITTNPKKEKKKIKEDGTEPTNTTQVPNENPIPVLICENHQAFRGNPREGELSLLL